MNRSYVKSLAVLLLTFAAFALSAGSASTADVLEFLDIPIGGDPQATIDPALACTNGVAFGFHAVDRHAMREDGPHQWDISFAKDDGTLLLKEYPLWLSESEAPVVHNGFTFPFGGFYTLLWNDTVPVAPLATCISGAGSGFCNTTLDIEDCAINPWLVANIAQIGPQDTTRVVTDTLVFEVRTYDPDVGTNNGDGIERVAMKIIDLDRGVEVFSTERLTTAAAAASQTFCLFAENSATNVSNGDAEPSAGIAFCAFSENCQPWIFSDHNYTWPDGQPVQSGHYLLRAIVNTPDDTRMVTQSQIEIEAPPDLKAVQVPAGDFPMGSDAGVKSEGPVHAVPVDAFWIMETEVTNGQYAHCVNAGACTEPVGDERWHDPAFASHPITNISWQQANDFATWAGGRLPTEAEWEKACRSTDGRTYPWGNEAASPELANYDNVIGDTTPVGSYPDGASPYGALDMSGNVWEWTHSLYTEYPYHADDGREDSNAAGPTAIRGGSYYYTHYQLACTARSSMAPDETNAQVGLRVVFDGPRDIGVSFVEPLNGAVVPPAFDVEMAAKGLTIEPAGEIHEGAGHFHILVDTDFVAPGELVPFDDQHLHFGKGQFTTTLELEPGVHTLRLQVANGAHQALDGPQYRDEITVTVAAATSVAPGVRFVTPADGATVSPSFDVEMAADGITIEPAGEIHEGAGHFHILVDTDFVAPGELIPFDDQHLHFGQGQLATTLELEPGVHSLRLQVANGAHQALDGPQYRDEITVTVKSGY